jgi:hypothetical protein
MTEIRALLDLIETKTNQILASDPYLEHRQIAEWAKNKGLIRPLTDNEIQTRMNNKTYKKVNKIIHANLRKQKEK